jgi:hypothetical protein
MIDSKMKPVHEPDATPVYPDDIGKVLEHISSHYQWALLEDFSVRSKSLLPGKSGKIVP